MSDDAEAYLDLFGAMVLQWKRDAQRDPLELAELAGFLGISQHEAAELAKQSPQMPRRGKECRR